MKTPDELLEQRKIARQEGDYALSDKIREKLDARNVFVFDTKDGQEVYFSLKGTTRESIITQMNEDRRANKMFDAWLYSVNKSRR